MRKLTSKKEKLLKDTLNNFPAYTDKKIATQLKITRQTVAKYRKEIDLKYDSEFLSITAGKFIKAFGRAEEYWLKQIDRLEELKLKKRTVLITDPNTKLATSTVQVDLEPLEILAIEKHQSELQKMVLVLASQGEVREVIRIMRSGKIPMLQQEV